jgi:hypothetical protein
MLHMRCRGNMHTGAVALPLGLVAVASVRPGLYTVASPLQRQYVLLVPAGRVRS